jgi:ESF2/ABP1 family protein
MGLTNVMSGLEQPDGKVLRDDQIKEFNAEKDKTGVVYMSRVPPLMSPHEIRGYLSPFGPIGRVYLTPEGALKCLCIRIMFI